MHTFHTTGAALKPLAIANWFALTPTELERTATALLGERPGGHWVRKGEQYAVIASLTLGSLAAKLAAELAALSAEAKRILAIGGEDAALRAAAFFHLRFEYIHPLREGNGRVGRTILAAQLHQAYGIPVEETLRHLDAHENDYKMAFPTGNPPIMFELMLDVIARLTGHIVAEESNQVPASILPLYPDRRPLVKNAAQQKRPAPVTRPPQRNPQPFFRQFR